MELKNIPLFQGLLQTELDEIEELLVEKSFSKHAFIFQEGACCKNIFIVREGYINLISSTASGREIILETLGPGGTCACHSNQGPLLCSSSAQAVTDCKVWFLPREHYLQLIQSHVKITHALNRHFSDKLRQSRSQLKDISLMDSKNRLAAFLLERLRQEKQENKKPPALFIPFTREEIAKGLGMTRETVTRQLYNLKRANLIDLKPHHIIILDRQNLEKLL